MNTNELVTKAYNLLMASTNINLSVKECAKRAYLATRIVCNDRLRVSAGMARCRTNQYTKEVLNPRIEWNPTLFARMSDEQHFNTMSHEFAHIVDFYCRLKSDHDYFWQAIHKACGGTGEQFHNYDTTGLKKKVKRRVIFDTIAKREIKVTETTFNRIVGNPKYILMRTEVYQGRQLIACHKHAVGA